MTELRYAPDFSPVSGTHVFFQWKASDVCLDFTCECGFSGHFDGYFAYAFACPECETVWARPHTVPLIKSPVDPELASTPWREPPDA